MEIEYSSNDVAIQDNTCVNSATLEPSFLYVEELSFQYEEGNLFFHGSYVFHHDEEYFELNVNGHMNVDSLDFPDLYDLVLKECREAYQTV